MSPEGGKHNAFSSDKKKSKKKKCLRDVQTKLQSQH